MVRGCHFCSFALILSLSSPACGSQYHFAAQAPCLFGYAVSVPLPPRALLMRDVSLHSHTKADLLLLHRLPSLFIIVLRLLLDTTRHAARVNMYVRAAAGLSVHAG